MSSPFFLFAGGGEKENKMASPFSFYLLVEEEVTWKIE